MNSYPPMDVDLIFEAKNSVLSLRDTLISAGYIQPREMNLTKSFKEFCSERVRLILSSFN